jgi:PilZ domain
MGSLEHRANSRVSLFQAITCVGPQGSVSSQAADVSEGGMFVDHANIPFPTDEIVTVRFQLAAAEAPIVAEAAVSYLQPGIGMGIRFLNLEAGDRERIAAYVSQMLRRPVLQGQVHLRKSSRVSINVPVRVRAVQADGAELEESTRIVTLSKHGACVVVSRPMDVGARLLVETAAGLEFSSSVVWVGPAPDSGSSQVGIQCRGLAQSLGFYFP